MQYCTTYKKLHFNVSCRCCTDTTMNFVHATYNMHTWNIYTSRCTQALRTVTTQAHVWSCTRQHTAASCILCIVSCCCSTVTCNACWVWIIPATLAFSNCGAQFANIKFFFSNISKLHVLLAHACPRMPFVHLVHVCSVVCVKSTQLTT